MGLESRKGLEAGEKMRAGEGKDDGETHSVQRRKDGKRERFPTNVFSLGSKRRKGC